MGGERQGLRTQEKVKGDGKGQSAGNSDDQIVSYEESKDKELNAQGSENAQQNYNCVGSNGHTSMT